MPVKLLWLLLLLWSAIVAADKKRVLSFGGNGNIGSEVLHLMFEDGGYDVTLVSRGNWHFDSALRVKPFLSQAVVCDRAKEPECAGESDCDINTLRRCSDLMEVVNATTRFDVVLDFSAYEPKWVHDAIDILKADLCRR